MDRGEISSSPMMTEEMLDAMQLQVWTADERGLLSFVNQFTADYFGKSREQLIGEGWQNVLHSSDVPLAVESFDERAVATGEPYDVDFRLLRASDRMYRWHHASARRIKTTDGWIWAGSNVDIDENRRATEVLDAWRQQVLGRT